MNNFQSKFSFELPTKIVFGPGCIESLGDVLKELGVTRPLFVTDTGITASGVFMQAAKHMPQDMEYRVFDGVEPNPKDISVFGGAKRYRQYKCDGIVAVGGGSPIDCAKAIAVLAANDSTNIKEFEGKNVPSKPLPPIVCIPTTSGTGSELTFSSVITDSRNLYKMTIKNPYTAPKAAICDPELTMTLPPAITASTGIDALTHAIEAYTATCAEPLSDAAALYAIELIYQSLVPAYKNGNDLEARSRMLMGSMLAGIAFSHSDVASVHCIAESLGGLYDLPHGTCNSIFLPYVMEYNMPCCEERYARVARAMNLTPDQGRPGAEAAVQAVKNLAKEVNLPSFKSLNVDPANYLKIAEMSAKNISTNSNPRPMAEEDYMNVLLMAAGDE